MADTEKAQRRTESDRLTAIQDHRTRPQPGIANCLPTPISGLGRRARVAEHPATCGAFQSDRKIGRSNCLRKQSIGITNDKGRAHVIDVRHDESRRHHGGASKMPKPSLDRARTFLTLVVLLHQPIISLRGGSNSEVGPLAMRLSPASSRRLAAAGRCSCRPVPSEDGSGLRMLNFDIVLTRRCDAFLLFPKGEGRSHHIRPRAASILIGPLSLFRGARRHGVRILLRCEIDRRRAALS